MVIEVVGKVSQKK